MLTWGQFAVALAAVLIAGGALYVHLRWHRSPRAYRAMLGVAACFLVAGLLLGVWVTHFITARPTEVAVTSAEAPASLGRSASATAAQPTNPLGSFSAKVVSTTDGDTVDVLGPSNLTYAVRLAGIDAPEHDQAFGRESTQHLSELLSGKTATLDCESERSYGRLICKILLPDGEDVCLDQVNAGMAWHYKQYQDEQSAADRAAYAAAECAAMKGKIGLWSDPHPVQPQDFRHEPIHHCCWLRRDAERAASRLAERL